MPTASTPNQPAHAPKIEPSEAVLGANLRLLKGRSAAAAALIGAAGERPGLEFAFAADGGVTATLTEGGATRQLASRRTPLAEGRALAAGVDISKSAAVVVRGFGLGHHVAALAQRIVHNGAIIVFEPDVAMMRSVLGRIDCTPWLATSNIAIITDPDDSGAIGAAVTGIEGVLAAGTTILDHPPSLSRIGEAGERFARQFTNVMKAVRTNVVTTLVQVDVTVRNLLQNLRWYATLPGVADLAGIGRGKPAIVVSAGPSLRRNIDLLTQPGIRDRVVIIAVQTVLKTLLAKGIRPHFVTALDYHEMSRRFYEGLTAEDVEGVTLVAEPKANPAILEAFPGTVRCTADQVLDQVLGPDLARDMGVIPPGATVAHLAYYLARHLSCDPVILIGQDLAFTDGQYYAPGAAIHQVWSGELNEFNTLEMLEWQRIARMRSLLRCATDQRGRPVYMDEQMSTYLVQFERDFMRDAQKGLTTIDATEGGVLKRHTRVMRLAEALDTFATQPRPLVAPPAPAVAPDRIRCVSERLTTLRHGAGQIGMHGREGAEILADMLASQGEQNRVNSLIQRVQALAKQATALPAFWLVQYINQTGQFNRYRADRAIQVDPSLAPMERQRKEIERDMVNVRWLADAADRVGEILDEAMITLRTGRVHTRDGACGPVAANAGAHGTRRVWACIPVDPVRSGLNTPRDLAKPFLLGKNPLAMTMARLAQCRGLDGVLVLSADIDAARGLAGPLPAGLRIEFARVDGDTLRERTRAVGSARLWARHCWRGGIANMSCYDEAFAPRSLALLLAERGIDAVVPIGADWALVDPLLVDAVIERYRERPDVHGFTFAHAAPGLGACLVSRSATEELAASGGSFATIGGLLGYIPTAPQADPIAKPVCITSEPMVRDLLFRCIPDSEDTGELLVRALSPLGAGVVTATAVQIAAAVSAALHDDAGPHPQVVTLCLDQASGGGSATVPPGRALVLLERALGDLGGLYRDLALTIHWATASVKPCRRLIEAARRAGFAGIHLRTTLQSDDTAGMEGLSDLVDVLSVDMAADAAPTFRGVTGSEAFEEVRTSVGRLLTQRADGRGNVGGAGGAGGAGLPDRWIVPRITRRDAVYQEIEPFYNRWLLAAGACVIDSLATPRAGEHIEPLPIPASVVRHRARTHLVIRSDGAVEDGAGRPMGHLSEHTIGIILTRGVAPRLQDSHCNSAPLLSTAP